MSEPFSQRRPLKSRTTPWAGALTRWLLTTQISADQVSVWGVLAALGAAVCLILSGTIDVLNLKAGCFIVSAVFIQLRLLCNMLDGLVAVEGRRASQFGGLYNEFPDRLEDILIFLGAGLAAGSILMGSLTALAAVMTAYVRLLGMSLGTPAFFTGPMAKPHRMAFLTGGCLMAAAGSFWESEQEILLGVLWVILLGTFGTLVRRVFLIVRALQANPSVDAG